MKLLKKFEIGSFTIYLFHNKCEFHKRERWIGYWSLFELRISRALSFDYQYVNTSLEIKLLWLDLTIEKLTSLWDTEEA